MIASPKAKSHGLGGGGGALVSIFKSAASAGVASAIAANIDSATFFISSPFFTLKVPRSVLSNRANYGSWSYSSKAKSRSACVSFGRSAIFRKSVARVQQRLGLVTLSPAEGLIQQHLKKSRQGKSISNCCIFGRLGVFPFERILVLQFKHSRHRCNPQGTSAYAWPPQSQQGPASRRDGSYVANRAWGA